MTSLIVKPQRVPPSKICCFSPLFFKRFLQYIVPILLVNQFWRFQFQFRWLKLFFCNYYIGCNQYLVTNLEFLKCSFWSCDWHTFCNILATKLSLHKELPLNHLASLPLIGIILLVIIQLIAYQQLYDKGPCFS